ncbi:apolipoprotein N-acyltransferase [Occallatibacter savannae]|uniref:apolipoprotein N-acyltransferase n=1 Tax=Occallatibacter savannae TaxID=1002691 RepID=UPI0013A532FC|nr:apolipoprotein N-acyltransferase [Occallatibacter savannae]
MKLWGAPVISAALLELPFPIAGPMPPWRSVFAWFGLVPLLWALLKPETVDCERPFRRAFLLGYLCGVLWYMGNCYWVRDTMLHYGDMPTGAPTLLLMAFSLVLGLYFGLFGLGLMLVRKATGHPHFALVFAPFLWTALELAGARITSVPWDQLGYSQVDNGIVNKLAPWTGVYGITFLLVGANALLAGLMQAAERMQDHVARLRIRSWHFVVVLGIIFLANGHLIQSRSQTASPASAILLQPNLDVGGDNEWSAPGQWDQHIAEITYLTSASGTAEKSYIAGIPQTGAALVQSTPAHPDLIVWPEAPSPFAENDPRFQKAMASLAITDQAPLIVGGIGSDYSQDQQQWLDYNSAMVFAPDGHRVGRYDKIHLVPFGEYIPFQQYLTFAHKLTGKVSSFSRGTDRSTFRLNGHRYGVFICYEAVFADEVRHFAQLGAEVLVNISDDGWYGDTSAPWQHLNMVRMRAIENRRWLLRATNNGVTAAIDPYGRVRQSIPRHQEDALPAQYGFRDDVTFYSAHGNVFAWLCVLVSAAILLWCLKRTIRNFVERRSESKVR